MTPWALGDAVALLERRVLGRSPMDLLDAANECPHGRLPVDVDASCGCWAPRAVVVSLEQLPLWELEVAA